MLIRLLLTLCCVMVLPNPLFGQEYPAKRDKTSALQHADDIPVRGIEAERSEAQEAEAREEALKSLAVHDPYTILPLPVFHYDRNESYWVGAVLPILESNSKGDLQHIYAPFYSHNRYIEETFGLYYYGYPSDTTQYSVTADYSTKVQRDIDLTYKNVAAGEGGRYILAGRVNWFKNPFRRLFGIGNQTLERDETSYTSRETLVELTAGINVNEGALLMWTEHYHDIRLDTGIVNSLPQFNQLPGMDGAIIVGHKLTARYDTRDKHLLSTRGTYVNLSIEFGQPLILTLIYRRIPGEQCDSYENMPCLLSTCQEKRPVSPRVIITPILKRIIYPYERVWPITPISQVESTDDSGLDQQSKANPWIDLEILQERLQSLLTI